MTANQNPLRSENNMPVRRVGTITSSATLVIFGIVLLVRTCFVNIDLDWLFRFSPLMLVLLGAEILMTAKSSSKYVVKYDFAAVCMCIFVMVCSMFLTAGSLYYTAHMYI